MQNARMEIRPIERSELPQLLELYAHLHADDEPLPDSGALEDIWKELLGSNRYRYLGAYLDGQLISSCTITIVPNLTRGGRPYGLIENVVTHADHRGHGYAKAVLHDALFFAWAQGCYKVMLMTGRKDEATLRFYESAGFDRHGKQAFIARP
ncbi:GNAT family N-acetyltransferase [Acidovorax sp. Root217]|uniref:GNAT family N-acetyltransferase n=1 Tax=Acidovorax sp. Root217 TaxID=1736492 RepID=UPI000AE99FA1|nr:GNAT family N-acetyltransferase [Acidovorax sp. Root217]